MTISVLPRFFCVFAVLTLASSLSAGSIIFQRALPTDNLNIAAGASRSNISWASGGSDILGDDFTLASDSVIDTLSVWEVSNNGSPNTEFNSITLYGGADNPVTGSPLSSLSSNYSYSLVSGYQYQGFSGTFYDVYKISFSNLSWSVSGGILYDFGIGFTPGGTNSLFLHASNATLGGSPHDGADDRYLGYSPTGVGSAPYSLTSVFDSNSTNANGAGWDKSSDINVEIVVPEPATFGLLSFSAAALLFLRRRRA